MLSICDYNISILSSSKVKTYFPFHPAANGGSWIGALTLGAFLCQWKGVLPQDDTHLIPGSTVLAKVDDGIVLPSSESTTL